MNKEQLINRVAETCRLSKRQTEEVIRAALEEVVTAVAAGEPVAIFGFGTFRAQKRNAREGRNPATGEPITISETTLPRFVPGALFKKAVKDAAAAK